MSDSVKAAAERLWRHVKHESLVDIYRDFKFPVEQYMQDKHVTSLAYLAEQDSTPITEEWLRSLGGKERVPSGVLIRGNELQLRVIAINKFFDGVELWDEDGAEGVLVIHKPNGLTRGDVRRLAAALGIGLLK